MGCPAECFQINFTKCAVSEDGKCAILYPPQDKRPEKSFQEQFDKMFDRKHKLNPKTRNERSNQD